MRYFHFVVVFIFLLISGNYVSAQNSDLRLRSGFQLDKDLSKKVELSFESQVRFKNNWSDFDKFLIEPSVKFEVVKNFRLGAAYRYSAKQYLTKNTLNWHRVNMFMTYKKSFLTDWDLKLKTAIQYDTRSFFAGYNPKYNLWTNRNKASLAYDLFGLPLAAEIGGELFYNVNVTQRIEKVRMSLEMSYEFIKDSKILVQYLNDHSWRFEGKSNHIMVVMYRMKIGK